MRAGYRGYPGGVERRRDLNDVAADEVHASKSTQDRRRLPAGQPAPDRGPGTGRKCGIQRVDVTSTRWIPHLRPGTGTPVWGGLASWQAAAILRGLAGVNLVGGDIVEVSPPFDATGITAIAGARVSLRDPLPLVLDPPMRTCALQRMVPSSACQADNP